MKLVTNENNPDALKIVIAAELSEKQINIENVENAEWKNLKRFPQLVLDSGEKIFSSNAAIKYLISPVDNNPTVNYFLDLEANIIQPLVSSRNLKLQSPLWEKLSIELNKLNSILSNTKYLTGDKISAADVSLWATLLPIAKDESNFDSALFKFEHLGKWWKQMWELPKVLKAVERYNMMPDSSDCLRAGHWFPNRQICKMVGDSSRTNAQGGDDSGDRSKESAVQVSEEEIKLASDGWSNEARRELPKKAVDPVLPVPGERNILITSALPYVNNVPHLGNIIGCVLSGDVFARYCRLRNYNTIHICGTDEYGTATETKALEENLTPKQICDKYFEIHDTIYKWFNIKFDRFGRTTTPEQTEISQNLFLKLYKNGFILSDSVEQLLCEKCDRYLADRFVEGTCPRCLYDDARGDQCDGCGHLINATELLKPRCKMCQATPVLRHSKQFFLDLPKVEPMLKEWIEKSSKTWSHNAREISKAWLNDGLKPRCITRDLKWGVPVPLEGYENKVFYVWFDAPIGYMSITKQYTEHWKKWWMKNEETDVKLYQFMAKDNVPFHSVLFPSSLTGSQENWILVENIFATEYLNYEDGKFSKSRGIGVFGTDAQDTGIPPDIWRFYLLYIRPESQDSSFSWNDLALKNNSELLNILGNFINRALIFTEKNYKSVVPEMNLIAEDFKTIALVNRELTDYISCLEKGKLRDGIRRILSIARIGNLLMQNSQPWVLFKGTPEEQKRGATVIGLCINLSCLLSVLLNPYMPQTSETIQKQLNADYSVNVIEDKFRLILKPGHKIGKPSPLFTKIEMDLIEKLKSRFSGRQKSKTPDRKVKEGKEEPVGNDVASLEAAVAAQGNKVREMKASGMSKSEWQPEVAILLDLKKKLEAAKAKDGQNSEIQKGNADSKSGLEELEKAIEEQGNVVRKLKESGMERSQWQPELNKLLDLKKKMAELKGEPITTDKKGKKSK